MDETTRLRLSIVGCIILLIIAIILIGCGLVWIGIIIIIISAILAFIINKWRKSGKFEKSGKSQVEKIQVHLEENE